MATMSTASFISINVKTIQNDTYPLITTLESTVQSIKQQIHEITSISIDRQRLIYRGMVLSDHELLLTYHVEDGHTLHMVVRPLPEITRRTQNLPIESNSRVVDPSPSNVTMLQSQETSILSGFLTSNSGSSYGGVLPTSSYRTNPDSLEHIRQSFLSLLTLYSNILPSTAMSAIHDMDHHIPGDMVLYPTPSGSHSSPPLREYYIGQWIDVKDTVSQWLEATVMNASSDSRRIFIHYNGWPTRWDEWLSMDSPRIAPFRSRTRHVLNPSPSHPLSPTPVNQVFSTPSTGADDMRIILPQVHRQLEVIQSMVELGSRLALESMGSTGSMGDVGNDMTSDHQQASLSSSQRLQTAEIQLEDVMHDLSPLFDRLGRALTDLAPHLSRYRHNVNSSSSNNNSNTSDPSSNTQRTQISTSSSTVVSSSNELLESTSPSTRMETALSSALRPRSPSPPPEQAFRRPIMAVEGRNTASSLNSMGFGSGFGSGSVSGTGPTNNLDIHITIIAPQPRSRAGNQTLNNNNNSSSDVSSASANTTSTSTENVQSLSRLVELAEFLQSGLGSDMGSGAGTQALSSASTAASTTGSSATPSPGMSIMERIRLPVHSRLRNNTHVSTLTSTSTATRVVPSSHNTLAIPGLVSHLSDEGSGDGEIEPRANLTSTSMASGRDNNNLSGERNSSDQDYDDDDDDSAYASCDDGLFDDTPIAYDTHRSHMLLASPAAATTAHDDHHSHHDSVLSIDSDDMDTHILDDLNVSPP